MNNRIAKLKKIEAEIKQAALIKKLAEEEMKSDQNDADAGDRIFDQLVDALFEELPD